MNSVARPFSHHSRSLCFVSTFSFTLSVSRTGLHTKHKIHIFLIYIYITQISLVTTNIYNCTWLIVRLSFSTRDTPYRCNVRYCRGPMFRFSRCRREWNETRGEMRSRTRQGKGTATEASIGEIWIPGTKSHAAPTAPLSAVLLSAPCIVDRWITHDCSSLLMFPFSFC